MYTLYTAAVDECVPRHMGICMPSANIPPLAEHLNRRVQFTNMAKYVTMAQVFFAILLMAFGLANAQAAFPDVSKASASVQNIFSILDRKPTIDSRRPGTSLPYLWSTYHGRGARIGQRISIGRSTQYLRHDLKWRACKAA